MKLFDIQTRKYLQHGYDWWYGGNNILTHKIVQERLLEAYNGEVEKGSFDWVKTIIQSKPNETLKTLCDLTGTPVYGGRYVLITTKSGIFCEDGCYVLYIKNERIRSLTTETTDYYQQYKQLPTEDILPFEEYSKSLRNEENKLQEIINLMK